MTSTHALPAAAALPITMFGAGYVGLVSAACMAALGHDVLCIDSDAARIAGLRRGELPFHEPGLAPLVARQAAAGRLRFEADAAAGVAHGRVIFIAVGTPPLAGGEPDLRPLWAVAAAIAGALDAPTLVVVKSTVPVGTGARLALRLQHGLAARGRPPQLAAVASNPEFLREGTALHDFMQPDRVVLGADEPEALAPLRRLYAPLVDAERPLLEMDLRSAEFTKYAANAMLAARLSAINELALLAEAQGADIETVRAGLGADRRIGRAFLAPGCGFGGSCLPKDVAALLHAGRATGLALPLLRAVRAVNRRLQGLLAERLLAFFGGRLEGRRIALWGLAFKPDTDDLREAPALRLVPRLLRHGAEVVAHDPVAMPAARGFFGARPRLRYADDALAALDGADALLIATDWPAYRAADPQDLARRLRQPLVFDGRNLFDPRRMAASGLHYQGIGRAPPAVRSATAATPVSDRLPAGARIVPGEPARDTGALGAPAGTAALGGAP